MDRLIVLVRHGKAEKLKDGQQDADRTLTAAGKRSLAATLPHAFALLRNDPAFIQGKTVIWTSETVRTHQTAEAVARALGMPADYVDRQCLLGQDEYAFLAEVQECDANVVIAVGHNPFMEGVAQRLCGAAIPLKPGAIGAFRAAEQPDSNHVLWFVQGPQVDRWKTLATLEKIIGARMDAVSQNLDAYLNDPDDVEAMHKFRVSIRTTRSLLAFVAPFVKRSQNREAQAALRALVLETSRLRELDVLCEQAVSLDPPAEELVHAVYAARNAENSRVMEALQSKKAAAQLKRARKAVKHLEWKSGVESRGLSHEDVELRFMSMLQAFEDELGAIDYGDAEATHTLRKHAKRLRYAATWFGDLLSANAADVAEQMKGLQDDLGALCDARANSRIIEGFPREGLVDAATWGLNVLKARQDEFLYSKLRESSAITVEAEQEVALDAAQAQADAAEVKPMQVEADLPKTGPDDAAAAETL